MRIGNLNKNSRRGGCLTKLFVTGCLLSVLLVLSWIIFLPVLVRRSIESRTGFGVEITSLSVNPFTARLAIDGLVITNPPAEFSTPDFVKVRSLHADAELFSLFSDRLVVEEAVIDIEHITLVKNAKYDGNGILFGQRILGESSPEATKTSKPVATEEPASKSTVKKEFLIRSMQLRMDKIVLVDASGSKPSTKEITIGFSQTYENVTTPTEIATPIISKLIANGGTIGDYAGELGKSALESAKKTGEALKDAGKKAGESLKSIFQSISDKAKK